MHDFIEKLKWKAFAIVMVEIALTGALWFFIGSVAIFTLIAVIADGILLYLYISKFRSEIKKYDHSLKQYIDESFDDVLLFSNTGVIIYNEDYVITFMSDLFQGMEIDRVGQKVLSWIPEVDDLISGKTDTVNLTLDDRIYEVHRKNNEPILLFKDITEEKEYESKFEEGKIVVALFNLDNYTETIQYEDEIVVSNINSVLRTSVLEYCKQFGILVKRTSDRSRFTAILTEKMYQKLVEDKFSIMNKIRKEAKDLEVPITLSASFARGSDDLTELDELSVQLMDLTQTRGGDQIASRKIGEDVEFYGGSSEAVEKRSRVRVRVMANTLKDLIMKSSNIIICGHREADFDCIGAAIGMSRIAECYHKKVCIIEKTGGVEAKLKEALQKNADSLKDRVLFVTESEALNQLTDESLVIMVDHHALTQSNGQMVLEKAKRIAIIDHHRRSEDLKVHPMLVYIEPAASSTSELITEFFPYVSNRLDINDAEATIMLGGITVDTNYFRKKTSFKTYDAASALRKLGANPMLVDEYLKDTYDEMEIKNKILSKAEMAFDNIVVSCVDDKNVTRSLISQAADTILSVQNVRAAFVIAKLPDDVIAVSARSNATFNVQIIMENMHGGGHMQAAALQRKNTTISDVKNELLEEIKKAIQEENHESHNEK